MLNKSDTPWSLLSSEGMNILESVQTFIILAYFKSFLKGILRFLQLPKAKLKNPQTITTAGILDNSEHTVGKSTSSQV